MLRAACSHADSAPRGVIRAVPSISQADYSSGEVAEVETVQGRRDGKEEGWVVHY